VWTGVCRLLCGELFFLNYFFKKMYRYLSGTITGGYTKAIGWDIIVHAEQ